MPIHDHVGLLLDTARQLGSSLEPAAIFRRLRDSVCGTMPCEGIIVSSFDPASLEIRCSYAWVGGNELDPASLPPLVLKPGAGGMQSQVIRTGRPMLFSDVAERVRDPKGTYYEVAPGGEVRNLKDSPPTSSHSAAMVPLRLEGEVVGVVQVMADREAAYDEDDLELLEGISLLLAVALENARLYRRAQDELEERRRAEHELRRTEEALREADRRKDEFLAMLGHELRNPLSPIRSAVELLRMRETTDPDERRSHDIIQRQVTHLARLIDDLLDVSRITQGRLELKREVVELKAVLESALEAVRPALDRLGHRFELEVPAERVRVDADPLRLAQVFSNLFDNAAKYTTSGGLIQVIVERRDGHALIAVRDNGAGIPREKLPHLFDLFFQADRSMGRLHGGLGIGLTLSRRLVEMHGGQIEAASEGPGHGSTFLVRLPEVAAVTAPAPRRGKARLAAAGTPRRILVADDNHDSADSIALLLRLRGNQVEVAYDGEDALSAAMAFQPEVLLLDIGMPRMNGYEVARRLRAEPNGERLVMIASTGWGQEEDRSRSMDAGFDAHVVKPVEHEALLQLVEDLATRRATPAGSPAP